MKIKLTNRAILKISGEDAQTFLQNQFSNDISAIKKNEIQLNAYCTHQGKIVALLKVSKQDNATPCETYFLDFPKDLLEIVEKRLKMFVLMSKVKINDISDEVTVIGVIDETDGLKLHHNLSLTYQTNDNSLEADASLWQEALINNKIPEVELATTEKFVPQMLNLDLEEVTGVNFKKGCYPGQEVVARLHYLGKAKRRLFRFKTTEKSIKVGDELFSHQSQSAKKSGIITSVIVTATGSLCLGCLEVSQQNETIYLNTATGAIMEILK